MKQITNVKINPRLLGFLLQVGAILVILLESAPHKLPFNPALPWSEVHLCLGGLALAGTLWLYRKTSTGKRLLSFAIITSMLLVTLQSVDSPARAFIYMVTGLAAILAVSGIDDERRAIGRGYAADMHTAVSTFFAGLGGVACWVLVFFLQISSSPLVFLAISITNLTAYVFALGWIKSWQSRMGKAATFIWLLMLLITIIPLFFRATLTVHDVSRAAIILPVTLIALAFFSSELRARFKPFLEKLFFHPEGAVIVAFLMLISVGSLLLYLPASTTREGHLSLVNSAFTAVSSVCVTGLTVLDISRDFTRFGQGVILILVQFGGLGIMTFSTMAFLVLGRRMNLSEESALTAAIGDKFKGEVREAVKRVLLVTVTAELLGSISLTLLFLGQGAPIAEAIWQGVFTAITAFCNAGFALQSDNLIPFQSNPLILHTIGILIIAGGLSPAFILAIPHWWKTRRASLQFKMIAIGSMVLLIGGGFFIATLEWHASLEHMSFWDRVHNSWFLSVATRTAGFNAIDLSTLNSATLFVMMAMMFIGGSPGGTSGGIKITTFMILFFTVFSVIKGHRQVTAFNKKIPHNIVYKAATVAVMGLIIGFTTLVCILMTQNIAPVTALFEVISALATVGLSIGGTQQLDEIGKVLIMICMFLGRVGLLSVIVFLSQREGDPGWSLAEENVNVT